MTKTITQKVLFNEAPTFTELKQMYFDLGGKDDISKLCKLQLANRIDKLFILNGHCKDFLKLADDLLNANEKVNLVYSEDRLDCSYSIGNFKVSISYTKLNGGCQYNCITYQSNGNPYYLYESCEDSFEGAMEWLRETRDLILNYQKNVKSN